MCYQSGRRKCHGPEQDHKQCYKQSCGESHDNSAGKPIIDDSKNLEEETYGGTWTEWTDWSPCSRSCNGGLTYITRKCLTTSTI